MSKFKEKVYEIVRSIPYGQVASYGQVALMAGIPRAAIQVGWVMHVSDESDNLPWWRVINNAGRISTTCEEHSAHNQKRLLEKEGIPVTDKLTLDIEKFRYRPDIAVLNKFKLKEEFIFKLIEKYQL